MQSFQPPPPHQSYGHAIQTTTNAATNINNRNSIAEDSLPDRVTKPGQHQHQWQMAAAVSHGMSTAAMYTGDASEREQHGMVDESATDRDNNSSHTCMAQRAMRAAQHTATSTQWLLSSLTCAPTTTEQPRLASRERCVEANVSSAHVVHGLSHFVGPNSESCFIRNWTNNNSSRINGAMRLNVPAAPAEGGSNTTLASPNGGGTQPPPSASSSSSFRVHENGTIMGAIVPSSQPSLTIQVNQNDLNGSQQQDVVNQSSGISIVNCYRAVPVQVVNSETSNGNVQIVNNNNNNMVHQHHQHMNMNMINGSEKCDIQCNGKDIVIDDPRNNVPSNGEIQCEIHAQLDTQNDNDAALNVQRTFISTEAQTDDLQQDQSINTSKMSSGSMAGNGKTSDPSRRIGTESEGLITRDQRRRDRRERRHRNARQQHLHPQLMQSTSIRANCEIIPDILHSHVPPPYTTLPMPSHCTSSPVGLPSPSVLMPNPSLISPLPVGIADDGRFTFPLPIMRR